MLVSLTLRKPGLAKYCFRRDCRFGDNKVLYRCSKIWADPEGLSVPNGPVCALSHQRSLGLTPPCWRQHLTSHRWVLLGSFIVTGGVAASGSQAHLLCIFHAGVRERHTPTQVLWSISQWPTQACRLSQSRFTSPGGSQWSEGRLGAPSWAKIRLADWCMGHLYPGY